MLPLPREAYAVHSARTIGGSAMAAYFLTIEDAAAFLAAFPDVSLAVAGAGERRCTMSALRNINTESRHSASDPGAVVAFFGTKAMDSALQFGQDARIGTVMR